MGQSCAVCKAPAAVRENVDRMLRNKTPMSRIAALAGCSKSAIGRHSLKCVPRDTLKTHGAAMHRRRLIIQQGIPPQYAVWGSNRSLQPSEFDYDHDLFVVVHYGPKGSPQHSQRMLTRDQAGALQKQMETDALRKAVAQEAEEVPAPELIVAEKSE